MYRIHLIKRAKEIIAITLIIIVGILIAHLFCSISVSKYERVGKFCDSVKGSSCTHYEVERILKRGY